MERDAQLVFTRNKCYAIPDKMSMIKGEVSGHREGYGFVIPDKGGDDIFLNQHEMRKAMHGDKVLVQLLSGNRKGKKEARLVRVLEPRKHPLVGRYFVEDGVGFVVPDDSRIAQDILIPPENNLGARQGNMVVVDVVRRGNPRQYATGNITEVLGEHMAPGMEVKVAVHNHDIPAEWPKDVLKQIEDIPEEVAEKHKKGRVDLRDLSLVTIDGEDARDFDDAVYCERKRSGGWRLWVAIADVSFYVRPDSPLDKEAQQRGNSVYFPSRVIPMLPERLSNGLCSLNPDVDRLCMVCEMTVSAKGRLSGYKFYEAVMRSHARLTYNKVQAILDGDSVLAERYQPLVKHLEHLHEMYEVLAQAREQRGAIAFESDETKFEFNAQRKIERIVPVHRVAAHKLIEECMILANVAAARMVEKHQAPALFRDHDRPGEERIKQFRQFISELGLQLGGGDEPTPLDFENLLKATADRPDKDLIAIMLLRTMRQAVYDPDNIGHFGLALPAYAHFTSPIRRYPDLTLHRTLKYLIAKEHGNPPHRWTPTGGYLYEEEQLDALGAQCSMTERRADDATRDVASWLKCEFMQDHVGDEFTATIANVTGFGFFARLDEIMIEGLVHISSLQNDYYQYDQARQTLRGEHTGKRYRIGDKVQVKVAAVHLDDRQIDLVLVENGKPVANGRKGAGKKSKNAKPAGQSRTRSKKAKTSAHSESAATEQSAAAKKKSKANKARKDKARAKKRSKKKASGRT